MIDAPGALTGFAILLLFMFLGFPVGASIMLISLLGAFIYIGWQPIYAFGTQNWSYLNNFVLTAIPLFILLGEILLKAGLTDKMYSSLSDWVRRLPGRLLHTNILACGLFSAVSGSSVATAATIGTVAIKDFNKRGYSERLVLGTIAAGATLGILIPPSINLIIYGSMTNTSIGQLFIAGFIPGLILIIIFMITIVVIAKISPNVVGFEEPIEPISVRLKKLRFLLPPVSIFFVVMVTIYGGLGTPTEAAAVGVFLSLIFAASNGKLSFDFLNDVFYTTVQISGMIMFILSSALFMNFIIAFVGAPRAMSAFIADLGLSATETILVLIIFYLILGLFMEALAMMVATIPIVYPLIIFLGIDPIWFGIFLVLMMEIALITPPVGLNLYVVQGVRGKGNIIDVFIGVIPFIFCMLIVVAAIMIFPSIVSWLPSVMF